MKGAASGVQEAVKAGDETHLYARLRGRLSGRTPGQGLEGFLEEVSVSLHPRCCPRALLKHREPCTR